MHRAQKKRAVLVAVRLCGTSTLLSADRFLKIAFLLYSYENKLFQDSLADIDM